MCKLSCLAPRSRRGLSLAPVYFILLLCAGAPAGAASWWVGNGGVAPCTHATLQAAIDAAQSNAGEDDVYLVGEGPFVGPFSVIGGGLRIVGGVAGCGSTTVTGRSFVTAASGQRPLSVLITDSTTLELRHLILTTEFGSLAGDGGCLWFAGSSFGDLVSLFDSDLANCGASGEGGGLFVSGGKVLLEGGSLVFANTAAYGGGVAAVNGARLLVEDATIQSNHAGFNGGGIYGSNANEIALGTYTRPSPTVVLSNVADGYGGGLYIDGGEAHEISAGQRLPPTEIRDNQAFFGGGGVYITDATLYLERVMLENNNGRGQGGGVLVWFGGRLLANTPQDLFPRLITGGYPRFIANRGSQGSGLYVVGGSAELLSGSFSGAFADVGGPAPAAVVGSGSYLVLSGVTFWGNEVPELFFVESPGALTLDFASIAGNTLEGLIRHTGTGVSWITLQRSAIAQPEPLFTAYGSSPNGPIVQCVVSAFASLLDPADLPANTTVTDVTIANPGFSAPLAGDFHVGSSSPVIDRCTMIDPATTDFDGDARGFDDPQRPNPAGRVFDAGADEVIHLFADGFETGNTSRWSAAVP